ncbi:3'-5' exonuclease [bacterium]|nr:3'-5' exonuclease [bacterium]
MAKEFKYLVYDIESVVNKPLLNKVLFAGQNLSDDEALKLHQEELSKEGRDFVNAAYHTPVCMAAAAIREDFTIKKIGLIGDITPRTPRSIVEAFWETYNKSQPILVDFNGRGYDARLMEHWAFQLGITIGPFYFKKFGPRYRFADEYQIDLQDFLTNSGAIKYRGGLDLFSKILGKPGKMETKGHMVEELFKNGEQFKIDDYCLSDVMDTYFVFLRTRVMTGEISLAQEQQLVGLARKMLEEKRDKEGYFKLYLEHFGEWQP